MTQARRRPDDGGPDRDRGVKSSLSQPTDDLRIEDGLDRCRLFGFDFVAVDGLDEVVEAVLGAPYLTDALPVVVTPNVDILVHLDRHPSTVEAEIFHRAQFCLPDGQPVVWASRLLGDQLPARLPGSGLFAKLWPMVSEAGLACVVLASSQAVADELVAEHPDAQTLVAPLFEVDDTTVQAQLAAQIVELARKSDARFVFVGISNPKDARVIASAIEQWPTEAGPAPLFFGLGASFSMYLGHAKRAPEWVQRIGMEWFHRFAQEPRRLFYRYFVKDPAFVGIVWREWKSNRA